MKKKLLIVSSSPRSLINFRGHLIRSLLDKGIEVVACSPDASDDIRDTLHHMGARYVNYPLSRAGLDPFDDFETIRSLKRLFASEKPDVVLAYTVKPIVYSGLAIKKSANTRFFAMITGLGYAFGVSSIPQRFTGAIVKWLYQATLRKADGVLFQNPDDIELFRSRRIISETKNAIVINGSGVDLNHFRPEPYPDELVFLLIARLLAAKGIREFYEAARTVKDGNPGVRFLLAGPIDPSPDAIQASELARWVESGVIDYLGSLEDVRPAYAQASVYVLPSYREGTPRTVLEAMAMARPVITTDVPGCRETVIHGQTGFLVEPRNTSDLSDKMQSFVREPGLVERMGRASFELATAKYDVHMVNRQIMSFIGFP